jgi:hypothetical protein
MATKASNVANGHLNKVSSRNYIRWDSEGVQSIPPHEAEDIQAVAEMINKIQRMQFNKARHCFSGKPNHTAYQYISKKKLLNACRYTC